MVDALPRWFRNVPRHGHSLLGISLWCTPWRPGEFGYTRRGVVRFLGGWSKYSRLFVQYQSKIIYKTEKNFESFITGNQDYSGTLSLSLEWSTRRCGGRWMAIRAFIMSTNKSPKTQPWCQYDTICNHTQKFH